MLGLWLETKAFTVQSRTLSVLLFVLLDSILVRILWTFSLTAFLCSCALLLIPPITHWFMCTHSSQSCSLSCSFWNSHTPTHIIPHSHLSSHSHRHTHSLPLNLSRLAGMTATAGLAFYIGAFFAAFPRITYLCFLIFEFVCGIYFPVMGDIREKHLPEQHRLSIVSIFRIPLTVISATTIWLYHYDMKGGIREILLFCGVLMTVACLCAFWFARVIKKDDSVQEGSDLVKSEEGGTSQTS